MSTADQVILDATGQSFGRFASRVAFLLRGKHRASFRPHLIAAVHVRVENISKIQVSQSLAKKKYVWSTARPGGLKQQLFLTRFEKDPGDTFARTVYAMLPKNSHRDVLIKHLHIA